MIRNMGMYHPSISKKRVEDLSMELEWMLSRLLIEAWFCLPLKVHLISDNTLITWHKTFQRSSTRSLR